MKDKVVSMGWHWTYGMQRLRAFDRDMETLPGVKEHCYCYESPDGDKIYTPYEGHRDRAHMVCREDADTGERYISFSKLMPLHQIMEKK